MYLNCPIGWCILIFLAAGDMVGRFWFPKASEWYIIIYRSLCPQDGPWLKGK